MRNYPVNKVYRLMEPSPIVLVTTVRHRLANRYNLFILKAVKVWLSADRKEKRTMHHQGNGTFKIDGKTIDMRERMVKWQELVD